MTSQKVASRFLALPILSIEVIICGAIYYAGPAESFQSAKALGISLFKEIVDNKAAHLYNREVILRI